MPEVIRRGDSTLTWRGREVQVGVERNALLRLRQGTDALRQEVQNLLRQNTRPPSAAGEPPAFLSGTLYQSVFGVVDAQKWTGYVGVTQQYGLYLEFGTLGGQVITARHGGVLSWVDPATGKRVYARSVTLGRIYPRPFLRPALAQARRLVLPVFLKPMQLSGGGLHVAVGA